MKALNLLAWIFAAAGIAILILGAIQIIFNWPALVSHISTTFLAANTCFMITITIFIYMIKCKSENN